MRKRTQTIVLGIMPITMRRMFQTTLMKHRLNMLTGRRQNMNRSKPIRTIHGKTQKQTVLKKLMFQTTPTDIAARLPRLIHTMDTMA